MINFTNVLRIFASDVWVTFETLSRFCMLMRLPLHQIAVRQVLVELKPLLSEEKLLVSIAAGIKMEDLQVNLYFCFTQYLNSWLLV